LSPDFCFATNYESTIQGLECLKLGVNYSIDTDGTGTKNKLTAERMTTG
jgi:hypothetical protein